MSKIHIGIVTTFPPSKGSLNEYAYHLLKAMRQKSNDVQRITLFTDTPTQELPLGEVPVKVVPCWNFGSRKNAQSIRHAVKQHGPDAVLFNIQFASFADDNISAAIGLTTPSLVKRLGIPTGVLLHNIMETVDLGSAGFSSSRLVDRAMRFAGSVAMRTLLQADFVALTLPKYVRIVREKYKTKNAILVPHGSFNDEVPQPVFDVPLDPMQIMTFGKFGTYKKVENLIEAFASIRSPDRPPLELVVAGSDSPNAIGYLDSMKEKYSHIRGIRYTGYVPEKDVPKIFSEAAIIVFPYSSTTGSSGVLHQAGDYGKAVVLPNIGDFAEVITEEGYQGEFFEPNSVTSLAKAIAVLVDNAEKRYEIGRRNFTASHGIPMSDIADWYILRLKAIL